MRSFAEAKSTYHDGARIEVNEFYRELLMEIKRKGPDFINLITKVTPQVAESSSVDDMNLILEVIRSQRNVDIVNSTIESKSETRAENDERENSVP